MNKNEYIKECRKAINEWPHDNFSKDDVVLLLSEIADGLKKYQEHIINKCIFLFGIGMLTILLLVITILNIN